MFAQGATGECVPTVVRTARILDLLAIGQHADARIPLLIKGEPGVGKDILARLIHADSPRRDHAFVKVNCAAQPADRSEADLFGHEKGPSPLATRRRLGSFEVANDGTLYLDQGGRDSGPSSTSVHAPRQVGRSRFLRFLSPISAFPPRRT